MTKMDIDGAANGRSADADRPLAGGPSAHPGESGTAAPSQVRPSGTLAVLTYRRPADLEIILPTLIAEIEASGENFDILVVDNDPAGSAAAVLKRFARPGLRSVVEPVPGISAARNRALAECADRRLLIFIDDDESPVEGWLSALLAEWRRSGASAVVGPVVSEFDGELDPWIVAGRFFARRRMPTGSAIDVAATNNLLIDLDFARSVALTFDEKFGITGGSDTLFTRSIIKRGGSMTWCDEAVVTDRVPVARMTRKWVVRRAFRMGNSRSRVALELAQSRIGRTSARARLSVEGLGRVVAGTARRLVGVATRSIELQARGARTTARGAGILLGAYGYSYAEYRRRVGG